MFYLALDNISMQWTMSARAWVAALKQFTIQFKDGCRNRNEFSIKNSGHRRHKKLRTVHLLLSCPCAPPRSLQNDLLACTHKIAGVTADDGMEAGSSLPIRHASAALTWVVATWTFRPMPAPDSLREFFADEYGSRLISMAPIS